MDRLEDIAEDPSRQEEFVLDLADSELPTALSGFQGGGAGPSSGLAGPSSAFGTQRILADVVKPWINVGGYIPFVQVSWWNADAKNDNIDPANNIKEFIPGAGGLDGIPDVVDVEAGLYVDGPGSLKVSKKEEEASNAAKSMLDGKSFVYRPIALESFGGLGLKFAITDVGKLPNA